jgi:WD40 repeat protein
VFASVTRDGRCEVWDLEDNALDPVITQRGAPGKHFTSVLFAVDEPVVLTAADDGSIDVFRVNNVGVGDSKRWTAREQAERLDEVLYQYNENKQANNVNKAAAASPSPSPTPVTSSSAAAAAETSPAAGGDA